MAASETETPRTSDYELTQKAADGEAKGGKIVRWEREGANYEVVIEKSGKEWGIKMDASGKVLSKHEESKEMGEKHEKH